MIKNHRVALRGLLSAMLGVNGLGDKFRSHLPPNEKSSKAVTLSALVHTPTAPGSLKCVIVRLRYIVLPSRRAP